MPTPPHLSRDDDLPSGGARCSCRARPPDANGGDAGATRRVQFLRRLRRPPTSGTTTSKALVGGRASLREEGDYEITEVEGTIPTSLRGTVYRNGPGNFERSGERFAHILDGDGLVCRFSIDGAAGRAHFRSRYVRTPEFLAEEEADAVLYRNTFGTQPDPWWSNAGNLVLKNVANTNIQAWGGKVLALWEAAPRAHRSGDARLRRRGDL